MTRPLTWLAVCFFFGWPPAPGHASTFPELTAAEVTQQIRRLDPKNVKLERLGALRWVTQHLGSAEIDRAVPALRRCVTADPEPEVRGAAIKALARLARRRKQPCPLVLIEAMLDKTDDVRWVAGGWAALFPEFEPGAAPLLLRGTKSENPDVRGNVLAPLAKLARKDRALLPALRERTKDKDWYVRNSAYVALYQATDQLDDFLGHLARERAAAFKAGPLRKEESEEEKRLRTQRNLLMIGAAKLLGEWLESRPKDLARALGRMLDDEAASERSAAATLLADFAAMYRDIKITPRGERGQEGFRRPAELPTANAPEVQAKQAAHLARQMRDLGVLDRLRKLAERDPDKEVRRAAAAALNELTWKPARS